MTVVGCDFICSSDRQKLVLDIPPTATVPEIRILFQEVLGHGHFYFIQNGRLLQGTRVLGNAPIHVVCQTLGGKGGFGSMLRAIGAQIEKTTNREACRDLSGRRLRDINEEQRLKNWIAQQAARESETKNRRLKKLQSLVKEPSHNFKDDSLRGEQSEVVECALDSIEQGLSASSSSSGLAEGSGGGSRGQKRKLQELGSHQKKRPLLWLGDDLSDSEEGGDDDSESGEEGKLGDEETEAKEVESTLRSSSCSLGMEAALSSSAPA